MSHCFMYLRALVCRSCKEPPCDRGLRGQDAAAELPRGKATFRALYSEDGIHPSGAGTYLEACVVASAITGAFVRLSIQDWSVMTGAAGASCLLIENTQRRFEDPPDTWAKWSCCLVHGPASTATEISTQCIVTTYAHTLLVDRYPNQLFA